VVTHNRTSDLRVAIRQRRERIDVWLHSQNHKHAPKPATKTEVAHAELVGEGTEADHTPRKVGISSQISFLWFSQKWIRHLIWAQNP